MEKVTDTFYLYKSLKLQYHGHLAGFDLDSTIIRPAKGKFPKTSYDIILLPNRIQILTNLQNNGWTIVIVTNQKVATRYTLKFRLEYLNYMINLLESHDIHPIVLASLADDQYRKPNIGMWTHLIKDSLVYSAFYVGDAAGRPNDFSDSDKEFAANLGIKFYTPEEIFGQ